MITKPCPDCGAKCGTPSWGGVIEFSTHTEQTCYLACSQCWIGCDITVNPESLKEGATTKIENQLFQVWNNLSQFIKQEPSND